jgi:ABC-type Zn uptake system ZnuABC Zn-binding protein ZnuA
MKRVGRKLLISVATLAMLLFTASSCRPTAAETTEHAHEHLDEMPHLSAVALSDSQKLQIVATTNIVADVVQNVGRDLIELETLMPVGTDPHTFEPTPRDVAAVADAHAVFANGAGLEIFLEDLLESAGEGVTVVPVSYGVELLQSTGEHTEEHEAHKGDSDPHTWFDPNNVMVWTHNIEHTLSVLDPDNAEAYEANATAYEAKLKDLDGWIQEQLALIPEGNRKLVTDHTSFSYFTRQYGFEQIGAVFPGYSTLAEPSAQDIAALEATIDEVDAKAVFVGLTVNPDLAERVAEDTGTQLIFLYTGSLGEAGGPADDYISFMEYNVSAIAEALRQQ